MVNKERKTTKTDWQAVDEEESKINIHYAYEIAKANNDEAMLKKIEKEYPDIVKSKK